MSRVLIVSKTRMSQNKVCVGGVDVDRRCSVRLMNEYGYHESLDECPYCIFDVWDLDYTVSMSRSLPHSSEDVSVYNRKKLGVLKKDIDLVFLLKKSGVHVYEGQLTNVFGGCLKSTESGSLFISQSQIPDHSTCFWICDNHIIRHDYQGKIRFNYKDGIHKWGYNISYVGLDEDPINIIPKGSLVRLSLAHWWSPCDDIEKRCYLQLSGCLIVAH